MLADLDPDAVRTATDKITADGRQALGVTCDVTDEAQVEAMIEQTVESSRNGDDGSSSASTRSRGSSLPRST